MTRLLTLAGLLASALPATAGWNTVFTATCCDRPRVAQRQSARCDTCAPAPVVANYAAACDSCAPPPTRVNYETTCRKETVTVMRPERVVEQVPVQVKSYYYEPVTTYTYRSYYDPCTQACQQVQIPRTTNVRRESCDTVMKAVERMQMVPVQVERQVCESRPVYTTYGPLTPSTSGATPRVNIERAPVDGTYSPIPVPGVPSTPNSKPSVPQNMPSSANFRSNALTTSNVKAADGTLRGDVVKADRATPVANAKLVFVAADNADRREYATADGFGGFEKALPAGDWLLYVGPGDGKASYHSKVTVSGGASRSVTVASR